MALVALSATAFGGLAIFAKIAYDAGADPVTVLAARFAAAALCMLAIMRARGRRFPRGRTLAILIGLGAVGYVAQSLLYFSALTVAPAALVALLLYVYPGIVTALAAALFRHRLTRTHVVALAVALAGTALTIGRASGGTPLGIGLGLGAAVAYALYILTSSRVGPRAGAIPSATVVISAAAVVLGTVAAVRGPAFPDTVAGWAAIAGLALVSTVVAIVSFFAGLARIGPAEASTVSTLEPMVTVLLAAAVLGERVSGWQMAGGMLILAAVVLMAQAGRPEVMPEQAPPT